MARVRKVPQSGSGAQVKNVALHTDDVSKLLILDLDETLIFSTKKSLSGIEEDFHVGPYFVYKRPGVERFIKNVAGDFTLAVWTSSSSEYAEGIVNELFNDIDLQFFWSCNRCTRKFDPQTYQYFWIKDLKKVKRRGYQLESIIMVDDTPQKLIRNYGNLVRVPPFEGDQSDDLFDYLYPYLLGLKNVSNVRAVEKRGWLKNMQNKERID